MITYLEGDIFNSPAQVIVNTVNTMGVMGKGIALEYKNRYPKMFESYRKFCENNEFQMGKLMLHYAQDHWILLFPTKENWRNPSKIEYIEKGLQKFVDVYEEKSISSIAFPRLGCGNGELLWDDVCPVMENYLNSLPIEVYIYLGSGDVVPEHKNQKDMDKWLRENAKDMSVGGILDDIAHRTAIFPIVLGIHSDTINVSMVGRSVNFQSDQGNIEVSDNEFLDVWDNLRSSGVVSIENQSEREKLIFRLLTCLGYLSEVRVLVKGSQRFGYQVNEGLSRVFQLRMAG